METKHWRFGTLEKGLERYPEAAPLERARALLYLAELAVRVGDLPRAEAALATARDLPLSADEHASVAAETRDVTELVRTDARSG